MKANAENRRKAAEFVSSGDVRLIPLLFKVCQPLARLLQQYLRLGGARWEAEQRAAAIKADVGCSLKRSYPLVEAALCRPEQSFADEVHKLLFDPSEWDLAHPDLWTQESNALVWRLLLRARAAAFQLLVLPHMGFPCKLFAMLAEPHRAPEIAATPECMRDGLAASFLAKYPGNALISEVARAELVAIAAASKLDIANVEVGHSRVRRRLMASSNNTYVQALSSASRHWVSGELRRRQKDFAKLGGKAMFSTSRWTSSKAKRKRTAPMSGAQEGQSAPEAKRSKRGGGGPYRAFVSDHYAACPDFRVLSQRYKRLPQDQRLYYVERGRELTFAHKTRAGPTMSHKRAAERAAAKAEKLSLRAKRLRSGPPIADAEDGGGVVAETTLALRGRCLREARALVVGNARADTDVRAAEREALAATLSAHCEAEAKQAQGAMGEALPFYSRLRGDLQPAPADIARLSLNFPAKRLAVDMLAHLRVHPRKNSETLRALRQSWERRHELVGCNDATPIDKAVANNLCLRSGVCLCNEKGRKTKAMRTSWGVQALARSCKAGSHGRSLLNQGRLICRLESYERVGGEEDLEFKSVFLHVSLMYWSPVRPTFVVLDCDHEDVESGRVALRTSPTVVSDFMAFDRLQEDNVWETTWYLLEEPAASMVRLQPGVVTAVPWEGASQVRFWPRRSAPRARRPRGADGLDASGNGHPGIAMPAEPQEAAPREPVGELSEGEADAGMLEDIAGLEFIDLGELLGDDDADPPRRAMWTLCSSCSMVSSTMAQKTPKPLPVQPPAWLHRRLLLSEMARAMTASLRRRRVLPAPRHRTRRLHPAVTRVTPLPVAPLQMFLKSIGVALPEVHCQGSTLGGMPSATPWSSVATSWCSTTPPTASSRSVRRTPSASRLGHRRPRRGPMRWHKGARWAIWLLGCKRQRPSPPRTSTSATPRHFRSGWPPGRCSRRTLSARSFSTTSGLCGLVRGRSRPAWLETNWPRPREYKVRCAQ